MKNDHRKYLIKKYRKLFFVLCLVYMFFPLIVSGEIKDAKVYGFNDIKNVFSYATMWLPFVMLIAAGFVSYLLFSKYLKVQSVDMQYALPIKKKDMLKNEVLCGWMMVCLSPVPAFLIAVLISFMYEKILGMFVLVLLVALLCSMSVLYLFDTMIVTKCCDEKDAIILLIVNAICFIFTPIALSSLFEYNSFQIFRFGYNRFNQIFYPITALCSPLGFYQGVASQGFSMLLYFGFVLLYSVISVSLYRHTLASFVKKSAESVGFESKSKWCYPFAVSMTSVLVLLYMSNVKSISQRFFIYAVLFIFYLITIFIAEGKVKLNRFKIAVFAGAIIFANVFRLIFSFSGGFGSFNEYRNIDVDSLSSVSIRVYPKVSKVNNESYEFTSNEKKILKDEIKKYYDVSVDIQDMLYQDFKQNKTSSEYEGYYVYITYEKLNRKDEIKLFEQLSEQQFHYSISVEQSKAIKDIVEKARLVEEY